jgi:hypothetical protein
MSLVPRSSHVVALAFALLAGCATTPPPAVQPDDDDEPMVTPAPPTPMIEYPPIEPVEPPIVAPEQEPATPTPAPQVVEPPPAIVTPPVTAAPPEVPPETLELLALLADLQRYGAFSPEDVKRELAAATQTLNRQRTDANRVRLAVLYSLAKTSPQDDQRALQLLDNVAKSNPGSPAIKQIASVLQAQISERLRAVRDEQQKADAAIQKLAALRAMERRLLRDRIRSGGGGGGAGGGGAGSAGGGGGGGAGGGR